MKNSLRPDDRQSLVELLKTVAETRSPLVTPSGIVGIAQIIEGSGFALREVN
jgi:hypothetical protein